MAEHNDLGKKGEEVALCYLVEKGYKIIEKNWRFLKDEIDIIALFDSKLIIVEVKTRSTDYFGNPEIAVTNKKQSFLIRAANAFIEKFDIQLETRFDVVTIVFQAEKNIINHIEDAFEPRVS